MAEASSVTYPDLAKEGWPIHTEFLSPYTELKKTQPTFFKNPQWPTWIADRAMTVIQTEGCLSSEKP